MAYRETQEQPDRPLRCPACKALMIRAPLDDVLYGCTGCGGCWTNAAAAKRVTSALDERVLELAARAEKNFADVPLPPDGNRTCAECVNLLEVKEIAFTRIDVCDAHGTFFDRGELERVARVLGSAIIGLSLLAHFLMMK